MAIAYTPNEPERYAWSPKDQAFLDDIWTRLKKDGYTKTMKQLKQIHQRLLKEGVGPRNIETLEKLQAARDHITTLADSVTNTNEIVKQRRPTKVSGESMSIREGLQDWYGEDAERLAALPGMKKIALDKRIPVTTRPGEGAIHLLGAYYYEPQAIVLDRDAVGPLYDKQNIVAHEMGHATMDLAGSPFATDKFYNWEGVIQNTDAGMTGADERNADYILGSQSARTPAEFAAYLLDFVRSNKGTHPALHPDGMDAGLDALLGKMDTVPEGEHHRTVREIIRQNPQLRPDLIRFFSNYAGNVIDTGNEYQIA